MDNVADELARAGDWKRTDWGANRQIGEYLFIRVDFGNHTGGNEKWKHLGVDTNVTLEMSPSR